MVVVFEVILVSFDIEFIVIIFERIEFFFLVLDVVWKVIILIFERELWNISLLIVEVVVEVIKYLIVVDVKLGDVIGVYGVCFMWE